MLLSLFSPFDRKFLDNLNFYLDVSLSEVNNIVSVVQQLSA